METFSKQKLEAARILQSDIPLVMKPFTQIAETCGLKNDELMTWIKELSRKGVVRKIGAVLRHQKAGYHKNALVMWAIPVDAVENAGKLFAGLPFISHCYERSPAFQNKYNLFTMLHAQDDDISSMLSIMSELIGGNDFLILESLQEYKKTSPEYF
ncbi:MAG: Lrp/AsnC family transcriptional regulator [Smithella sp.]|jgi:DNA-binding Lrp family transcriptional regulator